ncbi:Hok/Gef family protein [Cronobacter condimenti]
MPRRYLLACLLVVSVTLLIFTLMNRSMLCELTIRRGNQAVAAKPSCTEK